MIRLGLTGSYATGKSTVANLFKREGIPLYNADIAAHQLLESEEVKAVVQKKFPDVMQEGKIDRLQLGAHVFHDRKALHWLEQLLHPRVFQVEKKFFRQCLREGRKIALSEIPLLFEKHTESRYDYVIVTTAPREMMLIRGLKRKGMTEEKFNDILARQLPAKEKEKRADFVIHTGIGKAYTQRAVKEILNYLKQHA